MKRLIILNVILLGLILQLYDTPATALDMDKVLKLQKIQRVQQDATLAEAKAAAEAGRLSEADRLLEKARNQGYNPTAISETQDIIDKRKRQERIADKESEGAARQKATASRAGSDSSATTDESSSGMISVRFTGQFFWGVVRSIEISAKGRNTNHTHNEKGSYDWLSFHADYDVYDATITAYETSGSTGKSHSLKATFNHNCPNTNVTIDPGGGFIDPSIYVSCY